MTDKNRQFYIIFCYFTHLKAQKIKILKNDETIILRMCTKNHNHMMCGSWDTEWDRQILFVILGHFLSFEPLMIPKIKTFPEISLYTCTPYMAIIWCAAPEILSLKDRSFCHFGLSFYPLWTQKIKILKKLKKHLEILSFYKSVP